MCTEDFSGVPENFLMSDALPKILRCASPWRGCPAHAPTPRHSASDVWLTTKCRGYAKVQGAQCVWQAAAKLYHSPLHVMLWPRIPRGANCLTEFPEKCFFFLFACISDEDVQIIAFSVRCSLRQVAPLLHLTPWSIENSSVSKSRLRLEKKKKSTACIWRIVKTHANET